MNAICLQGEKGLGRTAPPLRSWKCSEGKLTDRDGPGNQAPMGTERLLLSLLFYPTDQRESTP